MSMSDDIREIVLVESPGTPEFFASGAVAHRDGDLVRMVFFSKRQSAAASEQRVRVVFRIVMAYDDFIWTMKNGLIPMIGTDGSDAEITSKVDQVYN